MSDILKGLTGGGWAGLFAWVLPTAIALALFGLIAYPQLHAAPFHSLLDGASLADKAGIILSVSGVLGFLLNAISTPLYRLLEGYAWPQWARRRGVARQRERRRRLEQAAAGEGWELGLHLEHLARFPRNDAQTAPTRLGNAFRSFETYGKTRFNLDSQTLWLELGASVPKSLQVELDRSRAIVDFFVALIYVNAAFGLLTALLELLTGFHTSVTVYAVLSVASGLLWYDMAVTSSSYLGLAVQALVNVGRIKLAGQLGLQIPATFEDERRMWGLVTKFVYFADLEIATELDAYRRPSGGESACASTTRKHEESGSSSDGNDESPSDDDPD
jgi:hypothetical protein